MPHLGGEHVYIPPERQSTRLKGQPRTSYEGLDVTNAAEPQLYFETQSDDVEPEAEMEPGYDTESEATSGLVFKTKVKLPSSNVCRRTLGDLVDLMKGPFLDLDPEYQRGVVWNGTRMSGLIDSILENYYVPPIIFNMERVEGPDGSTYFRRICVDGKQRLSSVKAFMDGKIGCHDAKNQTWYYCLNSMDENGNPVRTRGRKVLPESVKAEFRQKEFVCYELLDLSRAQEEDLFSRVQLGVQLTVAEKLRATTGSWQELIKDFEREYTPVLDLIDTKRARGFLMILISFAQIIEVQHPLNPNGRPMLRNQWKYLERFLKNKGNMTSDTVRHLRRVFNRFSQLVEEGPEIFSNRHLKHTRGFATMEFIAVVALISMYMDTRNNHLLLGDIKAMRTSIRDYCSESGIMQNATNWKHLYAFIENLESYRGAVDGTTFEPEFERAFSVDSATESHAVGMYSAKRTNRETTPEFLVKRARVAHDYPVATDREQSPAGIREQSAAEPRQHLPTPVSPGAQPKKRGRPKGPPKPVTPKRARGRPRKYSTTPSNATTGTSTHLSPYQQMSTSAPARTVRATQTTGQSAPVATIARTIEAELRESTYGFITPATRRLERSATPDSVLGGESDDEQNDTEAAYQALRARFMAKERTAPMTQANAYTSPYQPVAPVARMSPHQPSAPPDPVASEPPTVSVAAEVPHTVVVQDRPSPQTDAKPSLAPYSSTFQTGGAAALAETRRLLREGRLNKAAGQP